MDYKKDLIKKLVDAGCIKFGDFKLKSGLMSKFYINLREVIEHKVLFDMVLEGLKQLVCDDESSHFVGVPYGALILSGVLADRCGKSSFFLSKEKKTYGAGDRIIPENYKFLIVEDVMTTGSSIIETIEKIGCEKVTQAIVIVDRENGGVENIKAKYPQINVQSLLKISDMQEYLN